MQVQSASTRATSLCGRYTLPSKLTDDLQIVTSCKNTNGQHAFAWGPAMCCHDAGEGHGWPCGMLTPAMSKPVIPQLIDAVHAVVLACSNVQVCLGRLHCIKVYFWNTAGICTTCDLLYDASKFSSRCTYSKVLLSTKPCLKAANQATAGRSLAYRVAVRSRIHSSSKQLQVLNGNKSTVGYQSKGQALMAPRYCRLGRLPAN